MQFLKCCHQKSDITICRRGIIIKCNYLHIPIGDNDSYGYNDRSEVTGAVSNTDENYNYAYAFDNIGNRLSAEELAIETEYTTNNLNQYLTETTLPASSFTPTFDADGNLTETTLPASLNSTSPQTTQDASSPFEPTYDADGNQTLVRTSTGTWQVAYNGANRPILWTNTATGVKIHMIYDSHGRRIEKRVVNAAGHRTLRERYVYVGYTCVQILNGDANNAVVKEFVWDPTEPMATRPLKFAGLGRNLFYMHDGNKNVSDMVYLALNNKVGAHYEYAPFGAITRATRDTPDASKDILNQNPFRFSSEFFDPELGLVYYNYRHYSPTDGRWLSRDAGKDIFLSLNLYSFLYNLPFFSFDTLGIAPGDKRYGLPDEFWDWHHRQVKRKGDPDVGSKEEADELYDEWVKQGRPNGEGSKTQEPKESKIDLCQNNKCVSADSNLLVTAGFVAIGIGIILIDIITIPTGEGACGVALITWALAN